MNVSQDVSAIFRSPELSVVATQAVQAGEMAVRQGLDTLRQDALRAEDQVQASQPDPRSGAVDGRSQAGGAPPGRRQRRKAPAPAAAQPQPLPGASAGADPQLPPHRIDLVV